MFVYVPTIESEMLLSVRNRGQTGEDFRGLVEFPASSCQPATRMSRRRVTKCLPGESTHRQGVSRLPRLMKPKRAATLRLVSHCYPNECLVGHPVAAVFLAYPELQLQMPPPRPLHPIFQPACPRHCPRP